MPSPPALFYTTASQPPEQAFDTWRYLMAPMYDIKPAGQAGRTSPGGSTVAYLLGDMVANRTIFTAQHVTRDRRRVDNTPDHVLFQFWRSGGYEGEIQGQPITFRAGTVALSDRRRTLDVRFLSSDTVGLIVPRSLLAGIDLEAMGFSFDPLRNRLLKARIVALYRELAVLPPEEVPARRAELAAFLRQILDPSLASDVLESRALDRGLLALAEQTIAALLPRPDLTPEAIAAALNVSRATLYRVMAPRGGVQTYVQEQRLLAIRRVLADPLESRTITAIAARYGLTNMPHLSRAFRTRFDMTPRDWRAHRRAHVLAEAGVGQVDQLRQWFHALGSGRDRSRPGQSVAGETLEQNIRQDAVAGEAGSAR